MTQEAQKLSLLKKTLTSIARNGIIATFFKILRYPALAFNRAKLSYLIKRGNAEAIFTEIFTRNHWSNDESVSGDGSTLAYTENIRTELPILLGKLSVKKIFDAPCGDFRWMRCVLDNCKGISYIGGDIVKPLIEGHNSKFRNISTEFIHIDLINGRFPPADLMICRDCLFHFSFRDTRSVLQNFLESEIPFLLTTTHLKNGAMVRNHDIKTGEFRRIDLFAEPYFFPENTVCRINDGRGPDYERAMCLWTREQIATVLDNLKKFC
ncbi:class I SAM-dependent methyltransferase [uncultured Thiodictyon sp.]|uniref:class I SAM-dependent methyltransferase n=1 Tax=uncultured Thiodictyon sp. TaxID=1846217 RepID=UPI0025F51600|nr:class I SAM-dependent methyltransferase [uncultured Thiodictyon sp.]